MSNPQNPVISSSPIPPPLGNLPWGSIGPDGQVYLNQTSLSFLQMLWSQMQGQGGQIDLSVLNLDAPGTTIGRIAAMVEQIAAQLPLMTPPPRGPARQDVQDAETLADRPRVPGPSRSEVQDADLMAARPRALVSRQDVQDALLLSGPRDLRSAAALLEATDGEAWAGTSTSTGISPRRLYTIAVEQSVTYAATLTLDFNTGLNFKTTLSGNVTLANPLNAKSGQSGLIILTQDATGGRTASYGTNWKFPSGAASGGVLTTTASAVDALSYFVRADGTILATLAKDLKS